MYVEAKTEFESASIRLQVLDKLLLGRICWEVIVEWHPWLLAEGKVELVSVVNPTLLQRSYASCAVSLLHDNRRDSLLLV